MVQITIINLSAPSDQAVVQTEVAPGTTVSQLVKTLPEYRNGVAVSTKEGPLTPEQMETTVLESGNTVTLSGRNIANG